MELKDVVWVCDDQVKDGNLHAMKRL